MRYIIKYQEDDNTDFYYIEDISKNPHPVFGTTDLYNATKINLIIARYVLKYKSFYTNLHPKHRFVFKIDNVQSNL